MPFLKLLKKKMLSLVSTPIGNLEDITLRALKVLKDCDIILCEDTRRTKILLEKYNIKKQLISCHSYNQTKRADLLIELLKNKKNVVYVTDSGTPCISDPGYELVLKAIENSFPIECIPGPTAFVPALVCSGLPTDDFVFLGFLPRKKSKINKLLASVSALKKTIIFYESPYRIKRTIEICKSIFKPETKLVIAREITKKFEEFIRGTIESVYNEILKRKEIKGEIVVLLH